MNEDKITVYTDGAVIDNGSENSRGGWAIKLMWHEHKKFKSGHMKGVTNNYMEIYAVLQALKSISDKNAEIEIFTDSMYVVKTIAGEYGIKANGELWAEFFRDLCSFKDVTVSWIKGHDGNKHNEEVDRLANKEANSI